MRHRLSPISLKPNAAKQAKPTHKTADNAIITNNKKYVAKGLTNRYNKGQKGREMPNQPDVNKVIRSIQIPLELMARLRILAKERKMTVTQLISFILHEELDRIQLKEEDYEWIKEQVQKNERKRRNG